MFSRNKVRTSFALEKGEFMRLLKEFRISASYYQFFVHDSQADFNPESFSSVTDDQHCDVGSERQGYLTNGQTICFGTLAHLNVHWVEIFLSQQIPDFNKAERVIALPLQVNSGKVRVSVLFADRKPVAEILIPAGTWTVYLLAFNLGSDSLFLRGSPRPKAESVEGELSDEQLKARLDYERYKLVLVPGMQPPIGVLKGAALLGESLKN
jgi:hypothetical protein